MLNSYQDALSICTRVTKCDLFLTVTFNPKWPEVIENLPEGITDPVHAPFLTSRIFQARLASIKQDLFENGILGRVVAHVEVIEFQKRGYPHAHMLIGLAEEDKPRNARDIDELISAEIPDPAEDPELYDLVRRHMMHGPCGADDPNCPCMNKEGKCSKSFPKPYSDETIWTEDGFPKYRRRENGRHVVRDTSGPHREPVLLDNRFVVPYNRYLLKKFKCHINVEVVTGFAVVKYLYKYLYKGYDLADVLIDGTVNHDEIKQYVDMRYVSANEACWRLFEFPLHDKSHSVTTLSVHLPDQQNVFYRQGEEMNALQNAANRYTHLTAFFKLNREDASVNDVLYLDIIHLYSFISSKGWVRRKRARPFLLARLPCVSPRDTDRFHLAMLLLHVPGPRSFEHLRTNNGAVHPTYRAACSALGLVEDDHMWHNLLERAVLTRMAKQLRNMFAYMLIFCDVNDPVALWDHFFEPHFIDDIDRSLSREQRRQIALGRVLRVLQQHGHSLEQYGLVDENLHDVPADEEEAPLDSLRNEAARLRGMFYDEQHEAADSILRGIHATIEGDTAPQNRVFFIDGPGGTGKTFLYNFFINYVRGIASTVVPAAWSGIASTLLMHGKTVCSTFKLPVPCLPNSTCNIALQPRSKTT